MRLIFVALMIVFCTAGHAQPLKDFQKMKAKRLETNARTFYQQGRLIEAANSFRAAFNASSDPRYIYNVGKCYEKAKDYIEAATFYRRYLELVPAAKDKVKIEAQIKTLQLSGQADWGRLIVLTNPEGARVYLGSKKKGVQGVTPMSRSLPPGTYTLIIERKGHHPIRRVVRLSKKKQERVNLLLKPLLGFLHVRSKRKNVKMILDGIEVGNVPLSKVRLKTGTHYLFIKKKNYQPVFKRVFILPDKVEKIDLKLARLPIAIKRSGYWPWAWTTTGLAIASVAAAATLALLAKQDENQADIYDRSGRTNSREELDGIIDRAKTRSLTSNILFGIAGAMAVSAAVLFVMDWRDMKGREEKLFSLTPTIGDRFGVTMLWRY